MLVFSPQSKLPIEKELLIIFNVFNLHSKNIFVVVPHLGPEKKASFGF